MQMRYLIGGSLLALGLLGTRAGLAQDVAAGECRPSWSTFPMLGISEISCDCTVQARGARTLWTFRGEPVIEAVAGDGPAAGKLRAGDVLVAINGLLITTGAAGELMSALRPGQAVTLTIRRGGRTQDIRITPEEACESVSTALAAPRVPGGPTPRADVATPVPPRGAPPPMPTVVQGVSPSVLPPALSTAWFGFGISCTECSRQVRNQREIELLAGQIADLEGRSRDDARLPRLRARLDSLRSASVGWQFSTFPRVYSVDAGSPADRAGLRRGDLLTAIDGLSLLTQEGGRRFEATRPGQTVVWTVQRNNENRTIRITAEERPQPLPAVLARTADRLGETERIREAQLAQLEQLSAELQALARRRGEPVSEEVVELLAELRERTPSPPVATTRALELDLALRRAPQHLRFAGSVGGAEVEVRGLSSVEVSHDEASGELLIRTADATIRIKGR